MATLRVDSPKKNFKMLATRGALPKHCWPRKIPCQLKQDQISYIYIIQGLV